MQGRKRRGIDGAGDPASKGEERKKGRRDAERKEKEEIWRRKEGTQGDWW